MVNNENELRLIIKRILEEYEIENKQKKQFVIVFPEPWNNLYYLLLDEINFNKYNFIALVDDEISEKYFQKIVEYKNFLHVYRYTDTKCCELKFDNILYAYMDRNDISNIVNLRSDSFETQLIRKGFSSGANIYIWIKGIEKLSGKEPDYYKRKLTSYYEELLKFDIKIVNTKVVK